MERLYFDPKIVGSLGGQQRFFEHQRKAAVPENERDQFPYWEAYTVHRPTNAIRFPRDRTYVFTVDEQWQADLCDTQKIAGANHKKKFLLTVIDVLSRYAWVRAVKNKSGPVIAEALEDIFETSGRAPMKLQTDKGTEFYNQHVSAVLKEYDVEHFSTESPVIKASIVERFNRTLKNRMYRHMTHNRSRHYLTALPTLVDTYNKTHHSEINAAPASVNADNEDQVYRYQYADLLQDSFYHRRYLQKPKFKVGQTVRISKKKVPFRKGYMPNWSDNVFRIDQVIYRRPLVYRLKEMNGKPTKGVYYEPELQRVKGYGGRDIDSYKTGNRKEISSVDSDPRLKVDVIRYRNNKETGKRDALVHYRGYPEESEYWIAESEISDNSLAPPPPVAGTSST